LRARRTIVRLSAILLALTDYAITEVESGEEALAAVA
jgi:hypothetical protein